MINNHNSRAIVERGNTKAVHGEDLILWYYLIELVVLTIVSRYTPEDMFQISYFKCRHGKSYGYADRLRVKTKVPFHTYAYSLTKPSSSSSSSNLGSQHVF